MSETNREKELFERAVEIASGEERDAFLREACGGDAGLLQRLHALLAANDVSPAFLPGRPGEHAAIRAEGIGAMVGRYKLLEQIGEGGFGIVYMAEQLEPIRRRVALKIIKPGMDSRQVIARFEGERQALAMMDHPGIAQVFDAGATENGRPYFVMELVRGIPITTFCEERSLDTAARLNLFIQVCSAVQHAHQKGIIHRDLKPSNILVTLHGDRPAPKVIDFGIAKATREPLTDKTVFTLFQQFLGTPAYMSPEQAALSGLDVDTRSDIYSLGVLLYELLTGGPPFDSKELLSAGLDEMRKTIREREPERPSTRQRRSSRIESAVPQSPPPPRLSREMDLIVLKALAKDRDRRYATAHELAEDLRRMLNHEPVTAMAPTVAYQFAKFYRRHRPAAAAAAALAIVLLAASVVSAVLAIRARRAEALAVREAAAARSVSEFVWKELLKPLTPWQHTNPAISLRAAFDLAARTIDTRLADQPLAEASIRLSYGRAYIGLFEFGPAETNLVRALELRRAHAGYFDERTAEVLLQLGSLRAFQNRRPEAEALYDEAASIRVRVLGPHHPDTLTASAQALRYRAERLPYSEAEPLLSSMVEKLRRFVGLDSDITRSTMNSLGMLWHANGRMDQAFDIFEETQLLAAASDGGASSGALWSLGLMAAVRAQQGRFAEAEKSFLDLIAIREKVNGPTNAFTLQSRLLHVGFVLVPGHRFAEAAPFLLQVAEMLGTGRTALEPMATQTIRAFLEAWAGTGGGAEFEAFQRQASALLPALTQNVTNAPPVPRE